MNHGTGNTGNTGRIVTPKQFSGWSMSIAALWGQGPKFTIRCGECHSDFQKRIPMVDYPHIACPNCGAVNRLPLVMRGE